MRNFDAVRDWIIETRNALIGCGDKPAPPVTSALLADMALLTIEVGNLREVNADLLGALKALREAWDGAPLDEPLLPRINKASLWEAVRAAIAKAEPGKAT